MLDSPRQFQPFVDVDLLHFSLFPVFYYFFKFAFVLVTEFVLPFTYLTRVPELFVVPDFGFVYAFFVYFSLVDLGAGRFLPCLVRRGELPIASYQKR